MNIGSRRRKKRNLRQMTPLRQERLAEPLKDNPRPLPHLLEPLCNNPFPVKKS